jgi:EAL domain-containing protein (putative c-di-GMP-specific phosphodiesterase class I)
MSVNLSGKQVAQPSLVSDIAEVLEETHIEPRHLKLEITESAVMENAEMAARLLKRLKALGVQLSIDDFGTGYSSLSRLQGFRVDTLKIDRVFVSRMDRDEKTYEIVRVIVMLAHHLGLKVVAEGVETQAQLNLLRRLGCERAQGYLFSRPVDHEAILKLLATNRAAAVVSARSKAAGSTSG